MTPPRRAKLVLLVLAVAIVGLGVWRGEAVYWWVMTERAYWESPKLEFRHFRGLDEINLKPGRKSLHSE